MHHVSGADVNSTRPKPCPVIIATFLVPLLLSATRRIDRRSVQSPPYTLSEPLQRRWNGARYPETEFEVNLKIVKEKATQLSMIELPIRGPILTCPMCEHARREGSLAENIKGIVPNLAPPVNPDLRLGVGIGEARVCHCRFTKLADVESMETQEQ